MTDLRTELVQIAAVAVAWIEDLDHGSADTQRIRPGDRLARNVTSSIVQEVYAERHRQHDKFGAQHYDDPSVWLAILAEEVGEAAAAIDLARIDRRSYIGGVILASLLCEAETVARDMLADVTGGGS